MKDQYTQNTPAKGELGISAGIEALLRTTKELPALNTTETVLAIASMHNDPTLSPSDFILHKSWRTFLEQFPKSKGEEANLFTDPKMNVLIDQSKGNLKKFISLGNYQKVTIFVIHLCKQYDIPFTAAEDIVNFFMTSRMEKVIDGFKPEKGKFDTFLTMSIVNVFRDMLDGRSLRRLLLSQERDVLYGEFDNEDGSESDTERGLPHQEIEDEMRGYIAENFPFEERVRRLAEKAKIPEKVLQAIILRYGEDDISSDEIAELTGLKTSQAVRSALLLARRKIVSRLTKEEIENILTGIDI